MRGARWFRIAAIVMLLFAVGHTVGFLAFRPASAEGRAVWTAMNSVRFTAGKSTFSYGEFYIGFGLFISGFELFAAWLAWFLGSKARRSAEDVRAIAWAMFVLQTIGTVISFRYFSSAPVVLSAITAICLGIGAASMRQIDGI